MGDVVDLEAYRKRVAARRAKRRLDQGRTRDDGAVRAARDRRREPSAERGRDTESDDPADAG